MIHVVVGIISNTKGKVLIAERPEHKSYPGYWEFPGGKVEKNENTFDALQREIREELGIQIISADPWFQVSHPYPDRTVLLDTWLIKKYSGEPYGAENQTICWISPKDLFRFVFPEGNKPIIEALLNFDLLQKP